MQRITTAPDASYVIPQTAVAPSDGPHSQDDEHTLPRARGPPAKTRRHASPKTVGAFELGQSRVERPVRSTQRRAASPSYLSPNAWAASSCTCHLCATFATQSGRDPAVPAARQQLSLSSHSAWPSSFARLHRGNRWAACTRIDGCRNVPAAGDQQERQRAQKAFPPECHLSNANTSVSCSDWASLNDFRIFPKEIRRQHIVSSNGRCCPRSPAKEYGTRGSSDRGLAPSWSYRSRRSTVVAPAMRRS